MLEPRRFNSKLLKIPARNLQRYIWAVAEGKCESDIRDSCPFAAVGKVQHNRHMHITSSTGQSKGGVGQDVAKSKTSRGWFPLQWFLQGHLREISKGLRTGARKSTQTFSVQSFSTTLRVMDVRTENRGRPHQKLFFPAAPVVGRNFLSPGHPGVRVRNVRGKFGPKSLCLCGFFSSLVEREMEWGGKCKTY